MTPSRVNAVRLISRLRAASRISRCDMTAGGVINCRLPIDLLAAPFAGCVAKAAPRPSSAQRPALDSPENAPAVDKCTTGARGVGKLDAMRKRNISYAIAWGDWTKCGKYVATIAAAIDTRRGAKSVSLSCGAAVSPALVGAENCICDERAARPSSVRIIDHTYASGAGGIQSTPGIGGNASAVSDMRTGEHARSDSTDAMIARAHLRRDGGLWMLPYWTMSSRKAGRGW